MDPPHGKNARAEARIRLATRARFRRGAARHLLQFFAMQKTVQTASRELELWCALVSLEGQWERGEITEEEYLRLQFKLSTELAKLLEATAYSA